MNVKSSPGGFGGWSAANLAIDGLWKKMGPRESKESKMNNILNKRIIISFIKVKLL